jgi:hypothetical protein
MIGAKVYRPAACRKHPTLCAPFSLLDAIQMKKLMLFAPKSRSTRACAMSPENPAYTVLVAASSYAGLVTARTSDGEDFRSRQPLLHGARYWIRTGADPAATITTAWSNGTGEWVLRATLGHAARLTVKDSCRGTPTFLQYKPWPQGSSIG